jgi:predicted nucleotidyltransferase
VEGRCSLKERLRKELDQIVSIIKGVHPTKIYLFGSRTTDASGEESDIDLLVVAPSSDRPLDRRMKLRRMLLEYDRRIGLDLLVYTPDEFEMLKKEPSSFISSVIRKGTKLYDSEAH